MEQAKKCNKCDKRGYIVETPHPSYSAHSCPCGFATNPITIKKEVEYLLNYAKSRIAEKKSLM